MSDELVQPYCCAVCWFPLDQYKGHWVHGRELYGGTDHPCVPVPWDDAKVQIRCDFCDRTVPKGETWTLPAEDFIVGPPMFGSNGGWCACPECAEFLKADDWPGLIERALTFKPPSEHANARIWLGMLYPALRKAVTGPVRPYAEGDEQTTLK